MQKRCCSSRNILLLVLFKIVTHGNNNNRLDYLCFQIFTRQRGSVLPGPELLMALNLKPQCAEERKVSIQKLKSHLPQFNPSNGICHKDKGYWIHFLQLLRDLESSLPKSTLGPWHPPMAQFCPKWCPIPTSNTPPHAHPPSPRLFNQNPELWTRVNMNM